MKIFDKKHEIKILEDDLRDAQLSSLDFKDEHTRKRAYIDVLGARLAMKMLFSKKIEANNLYSLYTIHKILAEFDIADIYYEGIKIDVRLVFNREEIFIPKSHFKYNLTPHIYLVLALDDDLSSVEFLGYFEPKDINKRNENREHYFFEEENLNAPETFKTFLEEFVVNDDYKVSEEEINFTEERLLCYADNQISTRDKQSMLKFLASEIELREKFVEFENFELISREVAKDSKLTKDEVLDIIGSQKAFEGEEQVDDIDELFAELEDEDDEDNKSSEKPSKKSGLDLGAAIASASGAAIAATAAIAVTEAVANAEAMHAGAEMVKSGAEIVSGTADLIENAMQNATLTEEKSENNETELFDLDELVSESSENQNQLDELEKIADDSQEKFTEEISEITQEIEPEVELPEVINEENIEFEINDELPEINFEQIEEPETIENIEEIVTSDELEETNEPEQTEEVKEGEEINDFEKAKAEMNFDDEIEENNFKIEELGETNLELLEPQEDDELISFEEMLPEEKSELEASKDKEDDLEAKIREIEEMEDETEEQDEEPVIEISEDEDDSDDVMTAIDDFLKDVEIPQEAIETVDEAFMLDDELIFEPETTESPNTQEETKEISLDEVFSETLASSGLESDIEDSKNKDTLKLLFEKENLGDTDVIEYVKKKIPSTLLQNKKMVIAASLASIIVIGSVIGVSTMKNNQNAVMPQDPSTAPIAADAQQPQQPMMDMNSPMTDPQMTPDGLGQPVQQAIPSEAAQAPNDMSKAVSDAFLSDPVNATISKIAWEVPEDLAYNDGFRKYLQMAGKNLKLNLQNDLLLTNEMSYSSKIIVDLVIASGGTLQSSKIAVSSGSQQIDKLVLQSVKETLRYLKMPSGEINSPTANATLIINF